MRRIAHLSDVHMLDPQTRTFGARYRFTTRAVSLGRAVDPQSRARKMARALDAAKASGADHVVISGDLTELGHEREFEHFAEVLHDAKLPEDSVTLVPGNHDAYTRPSGWREALAGPLKAFARASAAEPGKVVDRGPVALLPMDVTCFQSIAFAGGEFTGDAAEALERRVKDPGLRDKALVVVMHHPPFMHYRNPIMQWLDGLRGYTRAFDLLKNHPRLQLLHGHLHYVVDRIVGLGKCASSAARARIFGAPATVDDKDDRPRVRLYDVRDGAVESAGFFAT